MASMAGDELQRLQEDDEMSVGIRTLYETRANYSGVVGSRDVTTVIHTPNSWHTVRLSEVSGRDWCLEMLADGIAVLTMDGTERRFRRIEVGCGRRFVQTRHIYLCEEVTE
jgi:hypothetical protein